MNSACERNHLVLTAAVKCVIKQSGPSLLSWYKTLETLKARWETWECKTTHHNLRSIKVVLVPSLSAARAVLLVLLAVLLLLLFLCRCGSTIIALCYWRSRTAVIKSVLDLLLHQRQGLYCDHCQRELGMGQRDRSLFRSSEVQSFNILLLLLMMPKASDVSIAKQNQRYSYALLKNKRCSFLSSFLAKKKGYYTFQRPQDVTVRSSFGFILLVPNF